MSSLREHFRKLYFRSKVFRHLAPWLIDDKPSPIDCSHFRSYREDQIGPLQRDEALMMFALTRVLHPETIVEFGFLNGHSSLNFLLAIGPDCRVFSYDIADKSEEIAQRCLSHFKNFRFIKKSQTEFSPIDIENRKIDLCFLDASHDLALNLTTLDLIQSQLSPMAIIAIHDTGVWHRRFLRDHHLAFIDSDVGRELGAWIDKERYQPCVEERQFVNTLMERYPEFSQIHLHSDHTFRHGLTLLQKQGFLATGLGPSN